MLPWLAGDAYVEGPPHGEAGADRLVFVPTAGLGSPYPWFPADLPSYPRPSTGTGCTGRELLVAVVLEFTAAGQAGWLEGVVTRPLLT